MAADLAAKKVTVRVDAIGLGVFPFDIVPPEFFEEYKTKSVSSLRSRLDDGERKC
jgi:hypothetical protein